MADLSTILVDGRDVDMDAFRSWLLNVYSLAQGGVAGVGSVPTASALPASTGSGKIYLVTSDTTTANNGYWQDQSGGNVILTALNAALKGAPGLLSAASNADAAAGTSTTLALTPANLAYLGLQAFDIGSQVRGSAAKALVSIGQTERTFAPTTVAGTGTATVNTGYATFNKDARNLGDPAPLAIIPVFVRTPGAVDIAIAVFTATNKLQVVDRFTVTLTATNAIQYLMADKDFTARIMPSGAILGVIVPSSGGASIAAIAGAGSGWLYYSGDPGTVEQTYASFASQVQLTYTLLPSAAQVADTQALPTKLSAFRAELLLSSSLTTREMLGSAPAAGSGIATTVGTKRTLIHNTPSLGGWAEDFQIWITSIQGPAPTIDLLWVLPTSYSSGASSSFRTIWRQTVTPKLGANQWLFGKDFTPFKVPPGAFPAFQVNGDASINIANVSGGGTLGLWYVDHTDAGNPGDAAVAYTWVGANSMQFSASTRRLPQTQPPVKPNQSKTLLESSVFPGTSLPSGWTATTGWTVNAGLISPTSGYGYGSVAYSNKMFALDERTTRISFAFLASGSYFAAGWRSAGTSLAGLGSNGSIFAVDMATNKLIVKNMWHDAGTSDPGDYASVTVPWTLAANSRYELVLTRNRRVNTATLIDALSGQSVSISDSPYLGATMYNLVTGEQIGTLCFLSIAGQYEVYDYRTLSHHVSPLLWIGGDSLTDGYNVPEASRWCGLGRDAVRTGVAISGLTADKALGVYTRAQSEMVPLLPRFALAAIGTNDQDAGLSGYQANINAFLTLCDNNNIVPIIGVPAPFASQVYTNMRTWITGLGRRLFRFDLALTTNNDGVTKNAALYGPDGGHWNADGHAAVFNRFAIDLPELFE